MKKLKFLSLSVLFVFALAVTSCNNTKKQAAEAPATETVEEVDSAKCCEKKDTSCCNKAEVADSTAMEADSTVVEEVTEEVTEESAH